MSDGRVRGNGSEKVRGSMGTSKKQGRRRRGRGTRRATRRDGRARSTSGYSRSASLSSGSSGASSSRSRGAGRPEGGLRMRPSEGTADERDDPARVADGSGAGVAAAVDDASLEFRRMKEDALATAQRLVDNEDVHARRVREHTEWIRSLEARLIEVRDTPAAELREWETFRRNRAAAQIQATARGWLARRGFEAQKDHLLTMRAVLLVQRFVRRWRLRRADRMRAQRYQIGAPSSIPDASDLAGTDGPRKPYAPAPTGAAAARLRAARSDRVEREIRQWRSRHAAEHEGRDPVALRVMLRGRLAEQVRRRDAESLRERQRARLLADLEESERRLQSVEGIEQITWSSLADRPAPLEGRLDSARDRLRALERRFASRDMERWWEFTPEMIAQVDLGDPLDFERSDVDVDDDSHRREHRALRDGPTDENRRSPSRPARSPSKRAGAARRDAEGRGKKETENNNPRSLASRRGRSGAPSPGRSIVSRKR